MQTDLFPEQKQALDYLRRKSTEAPAAEIRSKVEETFRELDALLAGIPEHVVRVWPRPGRWCVLEVVRAAPRRGPAGRTHPGELAVV